MSLNNIDLQILEVQTKRYRSSVGTRSRRSDRRPRKGGKPGQKSTFTGQRGEYVASNLEDFRNSKGAHQIVKQQFWTRYYAGYHARFNWQLPLDRDPSPDDVWKHDRELTPEETEEKSRVVALLEKQLKSSIRNLDNARIRKEDNPWTPLFTSLRRVATSAPPRKLADWQLYMNTKPDEIEETFAPRWASASLPKKDSLAFRGRVARELLALESDEFKESLKAKCLELHQEDLREHSLKNIPKALNEEEQRELARQELAAAVQPLLELVSEYTGYYCTLIAGTPLVEGDQEFQIKIMHAGKTDGPVPMFWNQLEGGNFVNNVVLSFTRFLSHTKEYKERQAALGLGLGASAASSSPPATSSRARDVSTPVASSSRQRRVNGTNKTAHPAKGKARGKRRAIADPELTEEDEDDEDQEDDEDDDEEPEEEDQLHSDDPWDLSVQDAQLTTTGQGADDDDNDDSDDEGEEEIADPPTADEIGLNAEVQAELAVLGERARRRRLWQLSRLSEYDLQGLNMRTRNKALMRAIEAQAAPSKPAPKATRPKPKPRPVTAAEPRRSSRLAPHPNNSVNTDQQSTDKESTEERRPGEQGEQQLGKQDERRAGEQDEEQAGEQDEPRTGEQDEPRTGEQDEPRTGEQDEPQRSVQDEPRTGEQDEPQTGEQDEQDEPRTGEQDEPRRSEQDEQPQPTSQPANQHRNELEQRTIEGEQQQPNEQPADEQDEQPASDQHPTDAHPTSDHNEQGQSRVDDTDIPEPSVVKRGWPAWVKDGYARLSECDYGPDFSRAIGWWTTLERAYQWKSGPSGLGTQGRPPAVRDWLQRGRKYHERPTIGDEEQYASSWWAWWTALQPDWRELDARGRPSQAMDAQDNWDKLSRPGQNGLLMVLLALLWWREAATPATEADWAEAAQDVAWVISHMARLESGKRVLSKPSSSSSASATTKKARRR